jgi:8-amino-7-oxononanoate synthase
MQSLDAYAQRKLDDLARRNLRRNLVETFREDGLWIERDGRRLLSFACNDYLNLSHHPAVKQAAVDAIARYGVGSGASRLITGNHPLYVELETRLARLKGTEAACVFGSGYLTNSGIIPVLIGEDGLVLIDELAHACLWAGSRLSCGLVIPFRHNDTDHTAALLAEHRNRHDRAMIVTDGVFSMDGDIAPLAELSTLAQRYDAWLMSDDAHGLGVLANGRGSAFTRGTRVDIPLQMGTLSKAIGAYGGYLCASQPVIDLMRNRARTLVYSTGLPPPVVAAAIAALDLIMADSGLTARPVESARMFTRLTNLPEAQSPIVPVLIGDEDTTLKMSRLLAEQGFFVPAIRPPTVPANTARLRLTFTAGHQEHDIERLAGLVRDTMMGR